MVDLIEAIVCCSNYDTCKFKDKLDCAGNKSGETYICDIRNGIKKWLSSFDTESATKCFEAIWNLKEEVNDTK